jgi:hypothetical protein
VFFFSCLLALHSNTQLVIKILSLKRDSPNFNLRLSGMKDGNVPKTLSCVIWQVITVDNNKNNKDDDDENKNKNNNNNNNKRVGRKPDEPNNSLKQRPF